MSKSQHSPAYRPIPALLRQIRESASLTQRELGARVYRPQSWIHNCECGNRRVDAAEFIVWCRACRVDPVKQFQELDKRIK